MKQKLHPTVIATGWVSFFNDLASEMIYPLLPIFLTSLGIGTAFIGLIEGAAESVNSFIKLFSGWISDRAGRKRPLILFGYGLASLARPMIGLATAGWQVLVLRLTDRFGKGVRGAPRDALVAELTDSDNRGRAFGYQRAMDHAGAIAGPLLASALIAAFQMDYRVLFVITLLPGMAAFMVAWVWVKEPKAPFEVPPSGGTHNQTRLAPSELFTFWRTADTRLKWLLVILGIFALGNSTDAFLILRAQNLGVPIAAIPILWAVHHVSKSLLSIPGGIISDRLGRRPTILAGWLVYGLVYLGFAFAGAMWQAWALFVVYGIFFALTEGVERAFIADLAPPDKRGLAFGFYYFILGLAALPASVVFGAVWKLVGYQAAFIMGACLALVAAAMLWFFAPEK